MEPKPETLPDQLPLQEASHDVLLEKYCKGEETSINEIYSRVAGALSAPEDEGCQQLVRTMFWQALQSGFIPAGRILSAGGVDLKATLINCFVQPVGDWLTGEVDGVPGIYDAVAQAAETLRRGGGVGYDFSRIRPKDSWVKGTDSRASGPLSFMKVFDESCKQIESAGSRRGAQMGVLRIDHPDILDFVEAKAEPGVYTQFNVSVAVTNTFLEALESGEPFELVHKEPPYGEPNARQNDKGLWVYRTIDPKELWDTVIGQTYDHAEPGVLFVDQANAENNLYYCEVFDATNPCAEQWLPPYGCCCLGSINLTMFVKDPFTDKAKFDFDKFCCTSSVAVRALDNVLDVTAWPLPQQEEEAGLKRRIGLGFTGLGNALTMLGLRYDSTEGLKMAEKIATEMRDSAYRASIELAENKGAFPLFDADKYLKSQFVARLPKDIREGIKKHGIRNSHLLSIAPTGTISLAMADNASNGIEPAFAWHYTRKKRMPDESHRYYPVVDHAFRRFCIETKGVDPAFVDPEQLKELALGLPDAFVSALELTSQDHLQMLAVVQPLIDSAISKTVNIPPDYPFDDFKDLYTQAAQSGLKGLATFRPNDVTGSVLSTDSNPPAVSSEQEESDRRIRVSKIKQPVLNSLRWPKRPDMPDGNDAWTFMVKTQKHHFGVFIGLSDDLGPFEVWVNGSEQPRGLGAIAKSISMDMRSNDRTWLLNKLESLEKAVGDDGFYLKLPSDEQEALVSSLVSGFAKIVKHKVLQFEAPLQGQGELIDALTPMMDALMSDKEPKTGPKGTMSWSVDVLNPATGDDFLLTLKELEMPDGQRRPYSVWMSGEYPRVFDGLCKVLSYDMRVLDPAWVSGKLQSLKDFSEARGDFLAKSPVTDKMQSYPSTVAYICELLIHRYHMLGIFDVDGYPIVDAGYMDSEYRDNVVEIRKRTSEIQVQPGKQCGSCHAMAVIKKDGCDFCTACFEIGGCG